jgi:hypothetical protein
MGSNKEIPYPEDAPQRAEKLYADGGFDAAIAAHFGVSRQIIYLWRSRHAEFDAACERGKEAGEAARLLAIHESRSVEHPERRKQPPTNASDQITKLCALGHTDFEIAGFFDTCTEVVRRWKAEYPAIADAFKTGKDQADERVERSFFHKAVGYTYDAIKIFNDKGVITKVPYVEHMPPDTVAGIFWLKNRRPEAWRDRREIVATGDGKNLNDLTNDELDRQVVEALRRAQELSRQVGDLARAPDQPATRTAKPDRIH